MESGKIYTAQEVLEILVATDKTAKMPVFGELRVRIAGVRGIVTPEHRIHIQKGVKSIEVVIGNEVYNLEVKD